MKVSLNWVKEFTSVDLHIDRLVEKIGAQLGAVEEVIDLGERYRGILVAKVIECRKHPNADKLSVCKIDAGKSKLVQVVCGAPNVATGQMVAWIPPEAVVPSTYGKDPFKIEAKKLRGVMSRGMIASAKELGLGDEHDGILVLDPSLKPGQDFATALQLDDYVIDIENKMFTHRPDCFGTLGVAREIAGINYQVFKSPAWYKEKPSLLNDGRKNVLKLSVNNQLPKLVPRFCAVAIKDIKVENSPAWLRVRLSSVGIKPINNIVDITNFLMYETGQPLHAYDYDKLRTGVLGTRLSKNGEKLKIIGGKELSLKAGAVVITDGSKPIGLGGVMGGADTEVDTNTKNIIIECATFDPVVTRKTAYDLGLFTDAATRFMKNQSPLQNMAVITKAVDEVKKVAGGRQASPIVDDNHSPKSSAAVIVSIDFINQRLGLDLSGSEIKKLLQNVEFEISGINELSIKAPFWRTDIEIPEDIVEEVGRLYGYDHLSFELPSRNITSAEPEDIIRLKSRLREILSRAGANEVLSYSFIRGSLAEAAELDLRGLYHIRNALSPDLQYYRQSLALNLLEKVHPNIKAGYDDFALFEIGKTYIKGNIDKQKLPLELNNVALVVTDKKKDSGAPYFTAKKYLDYLMRELGIRGMHYSEKPALPPSCAPGRSAWGYVGKQPIVIICEPGQKLRSALKLPERCVVFELSIDNLLPLAGSKPYYELNKYPPLQQDITLRVKAETTYHQANDFMLKAIAKYGQPHDYKHWLRPADIYQNLKDKRHKHITWHLTVLHPDRTLTTEEVNQLLDKISADAKKNLKAERV